jgi:hypothetical protein
LADKLLQLVIDALGKAVVHPTGMPLFGTKSGPGLFPATAAGRPAAEFAGAEGLIRVLTADPRGKTDHDVYTVTDAGRELFLRETRPKQVLGDLARALEKRHTQIEEMLRLCRETQGEVAAIKSVLTTVASRYDAPLPPAVRDRPGWLSDVRPRLDEWTAAGDCPLPELFRRLQRSHPDLTIGAFHDGLRDLHDRATLYLHPWTGPLYALPEPAFALLVGHEVAYYASPRDTAARKERPEPNGIVSRPFHNNMTAAKRQEAV